MGCRLVPSYHPNSSTRGVASASGVLGASVLLCSGSAMPVSYVPPFLFPAFYLFALPVGVSVQVAWALGASSHALSGGHVGPDVLRSSDCGILLSLVLLPSTTLSRLFHVPCPSGSGVRLPYRLPCLRHREFLPASVHGLSVADNLFTCGACGFSLSGVGRYHLLQAPQSSFSLRSPQYIVAVASRSPSTSSSFLGRLGSPRCSPLRVAVHHPLLPLALLSGCGFTLPLPLRPCCLLARRLAGFEVVSLAWLFFLLSVLVFFLFLVPSRVAVTCAWCLYSCCFSCYPLLPDCTYCAWRV